MLEEYKDLIGNLATVCTIVLFLSGLEMCAKFYKNKTTGDMSPLSFLVGVVMTFVWFTYGKFKEDASLYTVNGIGFILQSCFSLCFYVYAVNKPNILKKLVLVSVILSCIHIFVNVADPEQVRNQMGFLGAALSISFFASPLATIKQVIRTKSAETLPFYQIVMSWIVSGLWTLYGTVIADNFVLMPNFIGFVIATCQLGLFFYYPVNATRPTSTSGGYKPEILIS